ncbi:F-box domain [Phaffia rhodozyma]|uniref:F-box domain n=1 Tax=Phaffia rhodozyma TaxID=264483 RepID=A0A0F7SHK8_PHARH|nr:F-box domain [Phaffia rhodozyma]
MSTPSSMDHTIPNSPLNIPELLVNIFDLADPDTLATCARVCKHWSPLALTALWGNRPIKYSQLVDILKSGALQEHAFGFGLFEGQNSDSVLAQRAIFTRLPTREDLEKVQRYASWIKHLRLYELFSPCPTMLSSIQFPNLEILECEPRINDDILLKLAPACSPKMKRVLLDLNNEKLEDVIEYDENETDLEWGFDHYHSMISFTAINFIAQNCSTITELDIAVGPRSSSSFLKLLKPLSRSLHTLAIRAGNDTATPLLLGGFVELIDFTSLRSLEIEAPVIQFQCPPLEISGSATKSEPFTLPSVRSISIKDPGCEDIASILGLMPNTLTSITLIRPNFRSSTMDVRLLESTLDDKFPRLEQFRILDKTRCCPRDDTFNSTYSTLFARLVPKWTQLSDLQIYHSQLKFSQELLRTIEVNLTKLKILAIFVPSQGYSDLRSLSRALPELSSLAVAPRIRKDLSGSERKDWQFAKLKDFGGFPLSGFPRSGNPPKGSVLLGEAIEDDPLLAERFLDSCRLGVIDPEAMYLSTQPAFQFCSYRHNIILSADEEESTHDLDGYMEYWHESDESDEWDTE